MRAFDTGWDGAVWKTFGNPVINVHSRYAALSHGTLLYPIPHRFHMFSVPKIPRKKNQYN